MLEGSAVVEYLRWSLKVNDAAKAKRSAEATRIVVESGRRLIVFLEKIVSSVSSILMTSKRVLDQVSSMRVENLGQDHHGLKIAVLDAFWSEFVVPKHKPSPGFQLNAMLIKSFRYA